MHPLRTYGLGVFLSAILLISAVVLPSVTALAQPQGGGLRQQLSALAQQYTFIIKGLDQVGAEPASAVSGDLRTQVSLLLGGYNLIVLEDGQGKIREIQILGQRAAQTSAPPVAPYNAPTLPTPAAPRPAAALSDPPAPYSAYPTPSLADRSYSIKTTRQGSHHHVEAILSGPNGYPHVLSLLIDTGATTVVLPASLSTALGFRPEELQNGWTQTANGRVPIKRGMLASVKIGEVAAENVEVSFIADEQLGNQKILGMSFLRHFRVSLDAKNSELILLAD